jgi:hypothetical protein
MARIGTQYVLSQTGHGTHQSLRRISPNAHQFGGPADEAAQTLQQAQAGRSYFTEPHAGSDYGAAQDLH